jgi:uncharacterized protein
MTSEENTEVENLSSSLSSAPLSPIPARGRIITLDALRGLAVFGMLLVNILFFAFPPASGDFFGEGTAGSDQAVALLIALFADGKFITLFSILFGMGLALQDQRARTSGRPFVRVYVRRLIALFVIGIVHGLLFSTADILSLYAIVGLAALWLRGMAPKRLLGLAVGLYTAGVLLLGAYAVQSPDGSLPSEPDWRALVAEPESQAAQASTHILGLTLVSLVTERSQAAQRELYEFMADEERIFKSGSWAERVRYRFVSYLLFGMPIKLLFVSWRVLPLFLFGIYLVKRGIFVGANGPLDKYKTMLFLGLVIGLLLEMVGGAAQMSLGGGEPVLIAVFLIGMFAGVPLLSLAYAGGVAIVCAKRGGSAIVRAFAVVGRTALTNYVGQSVLAGAILYGHGLGLYGELSAVQCMGIALLIFSVQLTLSVVWLRFFQFGPLEWMWRTLSYGRIQPVRRGSLD